MVKKMKYFNNTNVDTIGDWDNREGEVVDIMDAILDKIDNMVIEKLSESDIIIKNTPEIHNMVWDYVCNQFDDVFETDDTDHQKAAEYIFDFIEVFEVEE
jgi:predicted component of type VI protein secretion system